jgi:hypothetical protein
MYHSNLIKSPIEVSPHGSFEVNKGESRDTCKIVQDSPKNPTQTEFQKYQPVD